MEYFKKILKFAIPYKKYGFLNILFNILYALFGTLAFVSLIPMLTVLLKQVDPVRIKPTLESSSSFKSFLDDSLNYFINTQTDLHGDVYVLGIMVGLVIATFLLKNVFGYLANYFITYLRNGVLKDIRNKMYNRIVNLNLSFYSEKRKGDTIARITSDVLEVQHSFLSILELFIREPLTILFAIGTMLFMSAQLTLFVFIFIPVAGFIISKIGKSLKKKSGQVQTEQGYFLSLVEETLANLKIIKGFAAEDRMETKFQTSTTNFEKYSNTLTHRQNLASPVSEFLGITVIGILLWYGGNMVLDGSGGLDGAQFIVYMGLAYQILTPAKSIAKASYSVKKGDAAAARILEVLETETTIKDNPKAISKDTFDSRINLEGISFKYDEESVLKNFTLNVKKGHTVALVGQSGSGKSTIANLVTRFYDVNEGNIKIDNTDIRDISKKSLRNLMGLVTQDAILFNDTIRNNINLGKENATDQEIIDALKIANAWEFVQDLPKGLDTNIGDSGNKLSGGQKQRLSIARAVLKNPPIMILDEATSALDTESERLVQKALENMMKNRTSIVIAHRLSTIQNADEIVVMQKGEIVEQGKHQELIDKKGMYHKLVSMQSFEEA
ncbi:antibiotic ABC transporter ATP-binding protein [Dokdonia sp. Dokd-P16]|uniref:ABC transporter ATP-binding protein n=1 Tax=Dokdonia sp. Dokd-P16 TaxID=2173169 RepID=UPI000D5460FC|nr:ABC transporter ATP-binding protein [Dokdonia sp. Dokd-P16]AWH74878.1 antibiotic ABC transporter ATP-binding protein [Dokdonia sp. Dokd-P16]